MNFLINDNCGGLGSIINLVKQVLSIVFILIGVVLVVLIIIDLAKAMMASEEKEVKGYQKAAIRRLVYTAVIFFVVTIVSVVFNLLSKADDGNIEAEDTTSWYHCWNDPVCTKGSNGKPAGTCANGKPREK